MGDRPTTILPLLARAYNVSVEGNDHKAEVVGDYALVWRCDVEPVEWYTDTFQGIVEGSMPARHQGAHRRRGARHRRRARALSLSHRLVTVRRRARAPRRRRDACASGARSPASSISSLHRRAPEPAVRAAELPQDEVERARRRENRRLVQRPHPARRRRRARGRQMMPLTARRAASLAPPSSPDRCTCARSRRRGTGWGSRVVASGRSVPRVARVDRAAARGSPRPTDSAARCRDRGTTPRRLASSSAAASSAAAPLAAAPAPRA